MRIQHNIIAMNAYRNYNNNTSALSKNLEKLSSGYKINRAGDDAAGLAISEKMRAQITGLNAAQKNVKDGVSLVKTAEGAMQEIQDMLNRMDYLATQSANGTYDDEVDRANLQKEVDNLKTEIDRIAKSANFNGIKLLDGSLETKTTVENIGDGKAAIVADYLVDESKDGIEPTAAKAATYTVKMDGLDTNEDAAITGTTKAGGNTVTAAVADVAAKFETDSVTSTTAGDIKVTVNYKDADGQDQTKVLDVTTSNTTAATAAGEIVAAINADADLSGLFTASVTNTDKITLEANDAGSGHGSIASIAVANGTTGQASLGTNPTITAAADAGSYDLSKFGTNATDDTITVNGKEYKAADVTDFAGLKAALEADGLVVNGNADGTNVTIKGEIPTGAKIAGLAVTYGTTTLKDLGDQTVDGKKISDMFDVQIKVGNTTTTLSTDADWTAHATDKLAVGAEIKFTAKIPGKVSDATNNAFKGANIAKGTATIDQEGIDEDNGAAASKAKYELTFDLDNLAGNQRVKIGDTTYELSTSGALVDAKSGNTLIDLKGLNPDSDAGKEAMRRLREREHDNMYAEFRVTEGGRCAFHTPEGLCRLQMECGAETLPKVCRVFPRRQIYSASALEYSLSPACEGVLELLWNLPEGVDFIEEPLREKDWRTITPPNAAAARFACIRSLCIDALQERSMKLSKRLLMLGVLLQQLQGLDWNDGDALDKWLAQGELLLHDPAAAEQLDQMPGSRQMFISNNVRLSAALRPDMRGQLFRELLDAITGDDGWQGDKITFQLPTYQALDGKLDELLGYSEYFLENLMVSVAFHAAFPNLNSPEELWKSYVNLCNIYSIYRFSAVCAMDKEASKARLFHVLVQISRIILHNSTRQTALRDEFFQNDSATLAHMAILVGG